MNIELFIDELEDLCTKHIGKTEPGEEPSWRWEWSSNSQLEITSTKLQDAFMSQDIYQ
jgi:hypothetical protein